MEPAPSVAEGSGGTRRVLFRQRGCHGACPERSRGERRDATVLPTFAKRTSRPEVEESLWGLGLSVSKLKTQRDSSTAQHDAGFAREGKGVTSLRSE